MSVSLQIDKGNLDHIYKQFIILRATAPRSVYSALVKIAYKIRVEAQLRLRGKNHIVTSRLRNSLSVFKSGNMSIMYSDNNGKSFIAELNSVKVGINELAIGTNVEYAQKIENMDSFLGWAVRNVDIAKSVADDARPTLENAMKFGKGIIPAAK